jgi:hypothetical protein
LNKQSLFNPEVSLGEDVVHVLVVVSEAATNWNDRELFHPVFGTHDSISLGFCGLRGRYRTRFKRSDFCFTLNEVCIFHGEAKEPGVNIKLPCSQLEEKADMELWKGAIIV